MKNVTLAFLTMLQTSAQLVEADLYEFALLSGTTLYYTSAQENIVYNGNTYIAAYTPGLGSMLSNPTFQANTSGTPYYTSLLAGAPISDGWSVEYVNAGFEAVLEPEDILIGIAGGTSVPANSTISATISCPMFTVTGGAPFTLAYYCSTSNTTSLPSGISVVLKTYVNWFTATGALISSSIASVSGNSVSKSILPLTLSGNAPSNACFAIVYLQASCTNSNATATAVGSSGQQPCNYRWYEAQLSQFSAPGFKRGQTRCTRGLDTDELEIDILYDSNTRIFSLTPGAFASAGGFDGATVTVYKALAPNWSNPVVNGAVNLFTGVVGETKSDSEKVSMTVSSMLIYLQTNFPRNYFLPGCNHALFDAGCGLAKSAYAVTGSVTGGATTGQFNSSCTQATDWFTQGYVVWTSGVNQGLFSAVKLYYNASGAFQTIYPLASPPAIGDTFTAYPGCDKMQTTCQNKFNNVANFRGFPYVPTPETLEVGGTGSQPPTADGGGGGAGLQSLARGQGGLSINFKQF